MSSRVSRNDFGIITPGGHKILPYDVVVFGLDVKAINPRLAETSSCQRWASARCRNDQVPRSNPNSPTLHSIESPPASP